MDTGGQQVVLHAGAPLLTETGSGGGAGSGVVGALGRWRRPFAVRGPAKVLTDLAVAVLLRPGNAGSDAAAEHIAVLREAAGSPLSESITEDSTSIIAPDAVLSRAP